MFFTLNLFAQISITQIEGYLEVFHPIDNSSLYIGVNAGRLVDGNFSRNTFVGTKAGERATTGIQNTYIGNGAGSGGGLFSTGSRNTFSGYWAGANNRSGSNNSFFGNYSGAFNTSNSYNSFFGSVSGNHIKADSCVVIGYKAGPPVLGYRRDQSNRLYINIGEDDEPLIYGEFDNRLARVNGEFEVKGDFEVKTSGNSRVLFVDESANNVVVWSGKLGVGIVPSPSDTYKLNVNGDLNVIGDAYKTTSGGFLSNSDARLKKDVLHLNSKDILQKVLAMQGVSYKWDDPRENMIRHDGTEIGFIAQDLQKIWPSKVSVDPQGFLLTSYGDFDPVFVEAIKAQQVMITALKDEIDELQLKEKEAKLSFQELSRENTDLKNKNILILERLKRVEQFIASKDE